MATFDRGFKIWAERTAIALRKELGLQPYDPLPAPALATHLDVELCTPLQFEELSEADRRQLLEVDPQGWSAVTIERPNRHLVIYNPKHSAGRIASDQMHELSHIVIGHSPSKIIISSDGELFMRSYDQKQEDEAAWLSGCLLLPREALLYISRRRISDDDARKQYIVSEAMLNSRRNLSGISKQLQRLKHLKRNNY